MRDRRHLVLGLGLTAAALVQLVDTPAAHACGCLSPPAVTEGDFDDLVRVYVERGRVYRAGLRRID